MPFDGKRVVAFESRRAQEMAELIRKQGGEAFVAPSMREVPMAEDAEVYRFGEQLMAGGFDCVVLMTGVGTRQLNRVLAARFGENAFAEALRNVAVIARGPKPMAALREMNVPAAAVAPEPNTWREVLGVMEGRAEKRIAVQEYGRSNEELLTELRARGAEVTPVRVYEYALPVETGPLREAARRLSAGEVDVALFTTATQIVHLAQVARQAGMEESTLAGLRKCFVASIGPTTTEALEEFGVKPKLEPSHPKMGLLVLEAAQAISPAGR
jgi:uroporphyrinogen-III synthase